jgi:ABC-type polysaccharide/polyol phosphate export permease
MSGVAAANWERQPSPGEMHVPAPSERRRQLRIFWRLTTANLRGFTSQRLLGWTWWLIDPLALVAVYALVFGNLMGIKDGGPEGEAYPFFLTCALVPWRWFSMATRRGGAAFTANAPLLSSTLIGRRMVMGSQVMAASLESLIGIPVLIGLMLIYGKSWSPNLLYLPIPLLVMSIQILAVSFFLCPLMVMLPDLGNVYDVGMRLAFFLTPCLYSLGRIPEQYQELYVRINPLAGVIEGIRRPLYDGLPPLWGALGWSAAWGLGLLVLGHWVFKRLSNDAIRML